MCFFLFSSTQIGILKRTYKGHLFSILSCVALHYTEMRYIFLVCLISVAMSWTVRCCILSAYWVGRKSVMEPKKFWCLTFSERGTFVLIPCLELSQMPPYSSLLCCCGTDCAPFQMWLNPTNLVPFSQGIFWKGTMWCQCMVTPLSHQAHYAKLIRGTLFVTEKKTKNNML